MLLMRHGAIASQGGTTDPDAVAYIARLTGSYSDPELAAINAFFVGTKADGVYSLLDLLYIHALDNEVDGRLNIKAATFTATRVNAMTFTARQGFTGNGSSSYLDTTFNPSTAGGNFAQNSGSMGFYTRNNIASDAIDMGIYSGGNNTSLYSRLLTANVAVGRINSSSFDTGSRFSGRTDSQRMLLISRISSTEHSLYGSSGLLQTTSNTSTAIVNGNIFIGTANNVGGGGVPGGGFSGRQFAFSFIGGGLTGTQAGNLTNRVNTLLTALGANV